MATLQQQQKVAIQWFLSMIKGMKGSYGDRKRVGAEFFDPKKDVALGQFFVFHYDAKLKDELPYWDRYPFVLVIDIDQTGFLGLNFHYLPPRFRKLVIDKLLKYKRKSGTQKAYLKVSYPFLKAMLKTKFLSPMIHRYLHKQLRSNFVIVREDAWENAMMLPVQKFQGATAQQVWRNVK